MSTEISGNYLANPNVAPSSGESLIPRITPEELCRLKSSEFPPPSPNLRFSIQVPMYNETPLRLSKFEDMGHLVRQLNSIASAALVSGTPDEVEVLLNIGNELDDTVTDQDGKVIGTQENMNSLELVRLIKDLNIPISEALDSLAWIDQSSPDYPAIRAYFEQTFNNARKALRAGMQVHVLDCTDGAYITMADPAQTEPLAVPNITLHEQLLAQAGKERFDQVESLPDGNRLSKFHIFLDADCMLTSDAIVTMRSSLRGLKGVDALLAPIRVSKFGSDPARDTKARVFNEYVLFESFVDICRHLSVNQGKGRYIAFGNASVARPYHWGAPWKGTYAVSHEAYKRSGGWNGYVYDTYDNGAGDQFQYNFMTKNGFQNFVTLPRPIVAQEFIPRAEALQAGCESKWQNITTITASNLLHQILNILNPYPVTGSSHDFYHIDYFRRPEIIIGDIFKGMQHKRRTFNMFEQALVKEFIDPQGKPLYPQTRLDFGDSVVSSDMLERLYVLEALGRRLAQSNNIRQYPNLLKLFQFIGLPANEVIAKTSPESTNMVYISKDQT